MHALHRNAGSVRTTAGSKLTLLGCNADVIVDGLLNATAIGVDGGNGRVVFTW